MLMRRQRHALIVGPTGTGKTVYVQAALDALDKSTFHQISTAFSAQVRRS